MIANARALPGADRRHHRLHGAPAARAFRRRPKVYFEEWDEPMISGIRWVSERVEIAGGDDVFATQSHSHAAAGRIAPLRP